ncbi:vang-like [Sarotherodon galilaeus]
MEERLINAVANHPELYHTSCFLYRDRNKKDRAWRNIKDICRRKWKSLRDTYSKEKRTEKEKRSGSAAGSGKRWKFFAVMGFLDPFLTPRETSGNMVRTVENFPPEDQGQPGEAAGECQSEGQGNGEKDSAAMATGSTHPVRSGVSQLL